MIYLSNVSSERKKGFKPYSPRNKWSGFWWRIWPTLFAFRISIFIFVVETFGAFPGALHRMGYRSIPQADHQMHHLYWKQSIGEERPDATQLNIWRAEIWTHELFICGSLMNMKRVSLSYTICTAAEIWLSCCGHLAEFPNRPLWCRREGLYVRHIWCHFREKKVPN